MRESLHPQMWRRYNRGGMNPPSLPGECNMLTKTTEREKIKRVENIQTNENKQTKETEEQFLYLHGRERFARQNPNARGSSHERRLLRFPRGAQ